MKKSISFILKTLAVVATTLLFIEYYNVPFEVAAYISVLMIAMFNVAFNGYRKKNKEASFLLWTIIYVMLAITAYIFSIYIFAICSTAFFMFIESGCAKKIRLYYLDVKSASIEFEIKRRDRSKMIIRKKYEKAERDAQHEEAEKALADFSARRELYVYKDI